METTQRTQPPPDWWQEVMPVLQHELKVAALAAVSLTAMAFVHRFVTAALGAGLFNSQIWDADDDLKSFLTRVDQQVRKGDRHGARRARARGAAAGRRGARGTD